MSISVDSVLEKAIATLNDDGVRWLPDELLDWFNDGIKQIVKFHPEASVTNTSVQLSSGTKQTIPSGGVSLVKVVNNMGTNGSTPGDVVPFIEMDVLDANTPGWHSVTASATTLHYMFDKRDPKNFYVYPQSDGTGYVRLVYSVIPDDVALGGSVAIDAIYSPDLVSYILYWAYQKDGDFGTNHQRTQMYLQSFMASMGAIESAEIKMEPKD